MEANKEIETTWPFSDIAARVAKIFADEKVTNEERADLRVIIEGITGGAYVMDAKSRLSTTLPLCHPQPRKIFFEGQEFCVTGRFAFGTRAKVIEAIRERAVELRADASDIHILSEETWTNALADA